MADDPVVTLVRFGRALRGARLPSTPTGSPPYGRRRCSSREVEMETETDVGLASTAELLEEKSS